MNLLVVRPDIFFSQSVRSLLVLILPFVLTGTMYAAFQILTRHYGYPLGYLLSFLIYWLFWCLLIPTLLLGGIQPLLNLFIPFPGFTSLSWQTHLALWWPILFPLFFTFLPRVSKASTSILVASLVLGIVIGVTEEILWRGLYVRLFPGNVGLNLVYPAIMFAIWHLAPLSVVPNRMPGGAFSFLVYALFLGLTYAYTVDQTHSIAWAAISHSLHDTLGLGAFAYSAWLGKQPDRE